MRQYKPAARRLQFHLRLRLRVQETPICLEVLAPQTCKKVLAYPVCREALALHFLLKYKILLIPKPRRYKIHPQLCPFLNGVNARKPQWQRQRPVPKQKVSLLWYKKLQWQSRMFKKQMEVMRYKSVKLQIDLGEFRNESSLLK
ncbi:MAG: hypothetical protein Q9207_005545 [Kuettlingeria erythrocarpa]